LGGKWPFWVSPRQAIVVPVSEKFIEYAERVQVYLHQQGFEVELDRSNHTLAKKVREA
jgi:threonyl-tRNA synthetase